MSTHGARATMEARFYFPWLQLSGKIWDKGKVPFCNGKTHSIFCVITRQVYTWGNGYCGALGHGDESDQSFAQQVVGLKSV
jgi:alpha-tubulin suppressor-like RCC1 family protein